MPLHDNLGPIIGKIPSQTLKVTLFDTCSPSSVNITVRGNRRHRRSVSGDLPWSRSAPTLVGRGMLESRDGLVSPREWGFDSSTSDQLLHRCNRLLTDGGAYAQMSLLSASPAARAAPRPTPCRPADTGRGKRRPAFGWKARAGKAPPCRQPAFFRGRRPGRPLLKPAPRRPQGDIPPRGSPDQLFAMYLFV